MDSPYKTGHSARVQIWLSYAGQMIPLTHASSTFVIAAEAVDLPPGDASIIYTIDDNRHERPVHLIAGMSKSSKETMVLSRDSISPF